MSVGVAPYISLIIPAYNRADFLPGVLDHIQKQTFKDFELILVDDGSTDHTADIVKNFTGNLKLHYIHRANGGPAAARQTGLEKASGDIIAYFDSDDIMYPNYLSKLADLYKNDPAANFCSCNHKRTLTFKDSNGHVISRKNDASNGPDVTLENFYNWQVKTTGSCLSHRRVPFAGKVAWRSGFRIQDLEFLLQLAVLDPKGFRYIPEQLLAYDQVYGGNGMCSRATYQDYAHAFGAIYELHKNDPLMKNPDAYLGRVEKYNKLHVQAQRGEIPPPHYKYFPELWTEKETT